MSMTDDGDVLFNGAVDVLTAAFFTDYSRCALLCVCVSSCVLLAMYEHSFVKIHRLFDAFLLAFCFNDLDCRTCAPVKVMV